MSDIQRWDYVEAGRMAIGPMHKPLYAGPYKDAEGEWVAYADHVAALLTQDRQHDEQQALAVAAARREEFEPWLHLGYEDGRKDAIGDAVAAVEAHLAKLDEDGWSANLNGDGFADMTGFGPGIIAAIKAVQS